MPNDWEDPFEQAMRRGAYPQRGKRKVDYMGILENIAGSIVSGAKAVKKYMNPDTTNNPYYGPVNAPPPNFEDYQYFGPPASKPKKKD